MRQHQEHVWDLERVVGTVKKPTDTMVFDVILQEGPPSLRRRFPGADQYLPTLVSPMSMPSLSNSPWMRGAPQSRFSRLILRISARTSFWTAGLPSRPRRTFHVQKSWKPLRCQAMTVSGLTITKADRQSFQTSHSHTQRSRSAEMSFGRFTERCRTPSWCRSARFSRWRAAPDLKVADTAANRSSALSARRRD